MQIGLRRCLIDGEDGVHNIGSEVAGQTGVELGSERGSGNAEKEFSVDFLGELKVVEELFL